MAIIIEEEKKKNGVLNFLGWFVVVVIVLCVVYYLFFASPPPTVVYPSASLKDLGPISQANLNVQDVLNSDEYQSLKQYVQLPSASGPVPVGRTNPFVSP